MKSFELMYSGDGIKFSRLTSITPKGSNSEYSYGNDLTSPENNYYQLRMIDLDGSVAYSAIVNLNCGKAANKITAGPNPFIQSVNVSIESITGGPATVTWFDVMGKMLSQKKVQLRKGKNLVNYDGMDNLSAGAYYLRIIHQDKTEYFKLIKAGR